MYSKRFPISSSNIETQYFPSLSYIELKISLPHQILNSLNAAFSEVFLSVDSLRWPMMRAQLTL